MTNIYPIFGGSTSGWLSSAEVEEKYAIVWQSPNSYNFEMPTAGSAVMKVGTNIVYFARKEQCLALGMQLRKFKLMNYKIYRIFPSKKVQYIHPRDGVFPEKVNLGRKSVNSEPRRIGQI
uniref:Photosystem I reaction center subunit II n=1 Tax=Astrosyne radiata TaxID=1158023 RepID=A0A2U9NTD7_9STRA|nr:photosystem I subunit II [Astrosyne radiata]AWT40292.1 photosystem I subunit II [Astrosyne radiata]|mmetsp:Transcript_22312/g.51457  ORF Transcript_22312/g.51457 Transcript_22312/m.51457 type:complete len:120 (+) Transcript_22312:164-523(+)